MCAAWPSAYGFSEAAATSGPRETGISHFIEHMVFKGTRNRSAEIIAAQVDSIGGHMDAFTAKEYASFHLKVLDEHLPLAVDILGDIVLNPLFDPLEMAKEKKVIFEEIKMVEDTPDDLVMELFAEAFWPDHPLGRPILGTRKSVMGFERGELLALLPPGLPAPATSWWRRRVISNTSSSRPWCSRHFSALGSGADGHRTAPPSCGVTAS